MGWRYEWYSMGALVSIMAILRVTIIKLKETPKYLLGQGKDEEVVETFQWMAQKYGRTCSLTLEQLQKCGEVKTTRAKGASWSPAQLIRHLRGLFQTRTMALSTCLVWFSWTLIGLAYPLYNVFLPFYLKSRGAETGSGGNYTTWRNYAIVNMCGIWGPVAAGFMCEWKVLGRRGTMVIGALITSTCPVHSLFYTLRSV